MSDIVLVSANLSDFRGRQTNYWLGSQGILHLTSMLEAHGYQVACRDYQTADADDLMDIDNLAAFLETDAPVLGVGCTSATLPLVIAATHRFKERHPRTRLVLGGPGPSEVANALLAAFPHVDVVVRGEGEETLLEIMRRRDGGLDDVPGLSYRRGNVVKANPPRPRIGDLDRLPNPAYHHEDWNRYEMMSVETARGCPYYCSFCSTSAFFQRRYIPRSLERVMSELTTLARSYGVRKVSFSDDTFVVNRQRVLDLCQRLRAADLGIEWGCYARVDLMDRDLMEAMAHAGCTRVFYGIEAGSQALLDQLHKGTTIEQAEEVVSLSTRYFAQIWVSFICCFPFESMEDFAETIKAAGEFARLGPQIVVEMTPFILFPSSPLYTQWRHLQEFSPSFVPLLRDWMPDDPNESKTWRELFTLVRAHPDVFAALYHVPGRDLKDKCNLLDGQRWLVQVLVGLAKSDEEFAARLNESPEAGLEELHIKPTPMTMWAAAEVSARMHRQTRVTEFVLEGR